MENEVVHKAFMVLQEGPIEFETVCGKRSEHESILLKETTCPDCLKGMKAWIENNRTVA